MFKLLKHLEQENGPRPRRATFRDLLLAVGWGFFGVRKMRALKADAVAIMPWQVIAAGIVGGVVLVAGLIALVNWVAR